MSSFSTILWDVDGTLLDFIHSQRYALTKCFATINREIKEEILNRYSEINDLLWKKLELGEITKEALLRERFVLLFEEYKITNVDVEAFQKEYLEGLGSVYSYIDDSLAICQSLQGIIKQYVVTNGVASTQLNKLKRSGFFDIMDQLFISEQIGFWKPQKEYFEVCLSHIAEKDKSKILLIGDSLTSDIKGGVLAGIPTCWYRPEGAKNTTGYKADYEISDLHQIYDILGIKA